MLTIALLERLLTFQHCDYRDIGPPHPKRGTVLSTGRTRDPLVNNSEVQAELTLLEASLRLGMPWYRTYALMCSGALGVPRKEGRLWRLPVSGVEGYIAQRATAARLAS